MCLHVPLGNESSYYEYLSHVGLHSENGTREGGGGGGGGGKVRLSGI